MKSGGLEFIEEIYINSKTPIHCKDKESYEYSLTLNNIKDKRTKHFYRYSPHNSYTINNLRRFIADNNLQCELLSTENPKNEKEKLQFRCACGKEYELHFNHLLITKKDTCNDCGYKRDSIFTEEHIKELITPIGFALIENTSFSYRSICIQDKTGYKYKTTIPSLVYQDVKPLKFHKLNPYTIENMKLYLRLNHIPVSLEEDNSKTIEVKNDYLRFRCMECGNIYMSSWEQMTIRHRYRCEDCTKRQSNLEYIVESYLKEKNISYKRQYRLDSCRDKRKLPFDFYLSEYNYVIEVQGDQHYYENPLFQQSLSERQRVDNIKKDYCYKNHIGYLAISRWCIQNNHNKKAYKEMINNITG